MQFRQINTETYNESNINQDLSDIYKRYRLAKESGELKGTYYKNSPLNDLINFPPLHVMQLIGNINRDLIEGFFRDCFSSDRLLDYLESYKNESHDLYALWVVICSASGSQIEMNLQKLKDALEHYTKPAGLFDEKDIYDKYTCPGYILGNISYLIAKLTSEYKVENDRKKVETRFNDISSFHKVSAQLNALLQEDDTTEIENYLGFKSSIAREFIVAAKDSIKGNGVDYILSLQHVKELLEYAMKHQLFSVLPADLELKIISNIKETITTTNSSHNNRMFVNKSEVVKHMERKVHKSKVNAHIQTLFYDELKTLDQMLMSSGIKLKK